MAAVGSNPEGEASDCGGLATQVRGFRRPAGSEYGVHRPPRRAAQSTPTSSRGRAGVRLSGPRGARQEHAGTAGATMAVLGNLGLAYADLGEVEKAIGYHERALVIAREIGDRQGEGNALGNLGYAYARLGEVEKTIRFHEQALVISREIGDRQSEGAVLGNLGLAYARLGEVEKAAALLRQAEAIGKQIGNPEIVQSATDVLEKLSMSE